MFNHGMKRFLTSESGAIRVDFVSITSGLVVLGTASLLLLAPATAADSGVTLEASVDILTDTEVSLLDS